MRGTSSERMEVNVWFSGISLDGGGAMFDIAGGGRGIVKFIFGKPCCVVGIEVEQCCRKYGAIEKEG